MNSAAFPTPESVPHMPETVSATSAVPPSVDAAEQIPVPNHTVPDDTPAKPKRKITLGENAKPKRARGRVRDLTADDLDKLRAYYETLGIMLMPWNAGAATALMEGAQPCTDAWARLAVENDNVRRAILATIEGGAWGAVFAAHVPIMLAFMPGHVRNMVPGLRDIETDESGIDQDS